MDIQNLLGQLATDFEKTKAELADKTQQLGEKDKQLIELKSQNDEILVKIKTLEKEIAENAADLFEARIQKYQQQLSSTGKLDESFDKFILDIKNKPILHIRFQLEMSDFIRHKGVEYHTSYQSFTLFGDDAIRLFDEDENVKIFRYEHPIVAIPNELVKYLREIQKVDKTSVHRRALIYLYSSDGITQLVFIDTQKSYAVKLVNYHFDNRKDLEDLMEIRQILHKWNAETLEIMKKEHHALLEFAAKV